MTWRSRDETSLERKEWKFFAACRRPTARSPSSGGSCSSCAACCPALFAIAMGVLVGAVQRGTGLAGPLAFAGVVFVLLQVLTPIHQAVSANLGDRTAAWLYDRLTDACVRPPGMGHLEDPTLTSDLTVARDFDLGMTGPPLSISMDFIAGGLVEMIGGLASAAVLVRPTRGGRRSCSAGAWLATHWLLRESAVWRDRNTDEVRAAQRDADYAYRLAVDPPAAQGAAAVRPRRLDDRPLRRPPHAPARAAVRGDAAARAAGALEPAARRRRQRRRVLVAGRRRGRRPPRPRRSSSSSRRPRSARR